MHRRRSINQIKKKVLVIGNEACDLDSVSSSLCYAYFKQYQQKMNNRIADSKSEKTFIPVLDFPKACFHLKTEVNFWLDKCEVKRDGLWFREDLERVINAQVKRSNAKVEESDENEENEGERKKPADPLEIILVDHNEPSDRIKTLLRNSSDGERVKITEIIDHHELSDWFRAHQSELQHSCIDFPSSNCTLIANLIAQHEQHQTVLSPDAAGNILARLLYGAILIDSDGLNTALKKVTSLDVQMASMLEKFLRVDEANRAEIYARIHAEKYNISNLSTLDLFHKDLKFAVAPLEHSALRIAVPTIVNQSYADLLMRRDFVCAAEQFLRDSHAHILVCLATHKDRSAIFFAPQQQLQQNEKSVASELCLKLLNFVVNSSIIVEKVSCDDLIRDNEALKNSTVFVLIQKDRQQTRKQWLPVIIDFLKTVSAT